MASRDYDRIDQAIRDLRRRIWWRMLWRRVFA